MNATQVINHYKSAVKRILAGDLTLAFFQVQALVDELQLGDYNDRFADIKQNYSLLLKYYVEGVNDPQRILVYNKLVARLLVLLSDLQEEILFRTATNFEYTQKRYFPHTRRHANANDLFDALKYYHAQSALLNAEKQLHQTELKRLRSNYEANINEAFRLIWLTTKFSDVEKQFISTLMVDETDAWLEKSMCVSALTMNLWRMFDENKVSLLFDCCLNEDEMVRQRALVGLCFVLLKYNSFLPYFPTVRNRLVLMADNHQLVENFQNIIVQLIATTETDKISKKMQDEILPEMMKISPLMKDKMNTDSPLNLDEWEGENPEWQELLEKSGVGDKLKELSELQMQGADVYMSTFSMLKSFPFFSEFTNWFLPFDTKHSAVNDLFDGDDQHLVSAFVRNNVMCNSDKYSFCLSILQMPVSQRSSLTGSFKVEAEQLEEMNKEEAILTPLQVSKNISKQYVQDLFRVFKINPVHADFVDMFSFSLKMHRTHLFHVLNSSLNIKANVAEYYFVKNHYFEAIQLFEEIVAEDLPTASIYQKLGYSYQQTSQLSKALDAYTKADIIQPDDIWTVRKIALCYRLSGNYQKALEYYQHADFIKPNQQAVMMQIANCLLELEKYKEALGIYFQLDADDPDNIKICRAIAWCAFVSGNFKSADYYSLKVMESQPTAHDYLNAGHIACCNNNRPLGIQHYKESLKEFENNWDKFYEMFSNDKPYLLSNGLDVNEIPLLLDAVRMN